MSVGGRRRTVSASGCGPLGAKKCLPDVGQEDAGDLASTNPEASGPGGLGWPRAVRLLRSSDFRAVYRSGRRLASPHFVAFVLPNGRPHSRFGLSIKGVPKGRGAAVARNRIKRRVREILRRCRAEIPAGWDIVLHPKPAAGTRDFAALEAEVVRLFAKGLS